MEKSDHSRPVLAVVVGTYNRLGQLREMVRSVVEQTRTPFRLYVTDAGSTDGTVDYLRTLAEQDPRVVPFLTGKKIGQARSLNEVFRLVDTPFVCWLSDDNEVVNGGLDFGVEILQSQPKIGMVGLKVKDVRGPFVSAPYIGGISSLGILNVNQGMLRTPLLKELGGFAEDYLDYGIDPDLTARVLFSGWDVVYTRPVAIHHHREWAEKSSPEELARRKERQRLSVEHYERKFALAGRACPEFGWSLKKRFYTWALGLAARLGKDVRKQQGLIFGHHFRDIHNTFQCRFISVLTLMGSRRRSYYLRQKGIRVPEIHQLPAGQRCAA